jgi:trimethylamine--corrinoid protein Co-methyltransferase
MAALAGANLIYGLGMIESGQTLDYGQLVMDDEFARMIKQVVAGIRVDDTTLAVDVIHEIGPFGDFLSHADTYRHMRGQSMSKLIDRRVREDWTADGGADIHRRATEEARRILETHHPEPLPEAVMAEMRGIVDELDRALAKRSSALPKEGANM